MGSNNPHSWNRNRGQNKNRESIPAAGNDSRSFLNVHRSFATSLGGFKGKIKQAQFV
jgi:hypothetical protein